MKQIFRVTKLETEELQLLPGFIGDPDDASEFTGFA